MELLLTRDTRTEDCTLGILLIAGKKLHTIERPWIESPNGGKSGKRFESCVAAGLYRIEPHRSEKHATAWALVNPDLDVYHWPADVPISKQPRARTAILIHAANYADEVVGCIGVGRDRVRNSRWMVTQSRDALNILKTLIGPSLDVRLTILDAVPIPSPR